MDRRPQARDRIENRPRISGQFGAGIERDRIVQSPAAPDKSRPVRLELKPLIRDWPTIAQHGVKSPKLLFIAASRPTPSENRMPVTAELRFNKQLRKRRMAAISVL